MDPTTAAPIAAQLTAVFGAHAAGVIIGVAMLVALCAHAVMPYAPVATATSPTWYRVMYGVISCLSGNYLKASPTPNGAEVAAALGVPPAGDPK
jgi:hypothetical protein